MILTVADAGLPILALGREGPKSCKESWIDSSLSITSSSMMGMLTSFDASPDENDTLKPAVGM